MFTDVLISSTLRFYMGVYDRIRFSPQFHLWEHQAERYFPSIGPSRTPMSGPRRSGRSQRLGGDLRVAPCHGRSARQAAAALRERRMRKTRTDRFFPRPGRDPMEMVFEKGPFREDFLECFFSGWKQYIMYNYIHIFLYIFWRDSYPSQSTL